MKVQIAARDFEFALQGDPCHCPVANAVHRKTHRSVHVSPLFVQVRGVGTFQLPARVTQFIRDFDAGHIEGPRKLTFEMRKVSRTKILAKAWEWGKASST